MKGEFIDSAVEHILKELVLHNITKSLEIDFEAVQQAHDAIHIFLHIQPLSKPRNASYLTKVAYLAYAWDAFHYAHRSLNAALSGFYNIAYSLLRSVYEMVIRGAIWQCLTEVRFRSNARKLEPKKKKERKLPSIAEYLDNIIRESPSIQDGLTENSITVFDLVDDILEDTKLERKIVYMPNVRSMMEQLFDWGILEQDRENCMREHSRLFDLLSKNVHVLPDQLDIMRRILSKEQIEVFKVELLSDELSYYLWNLYRVMEFLIVLEISLLRDWFVQGPSSPEKLFKQVEALRSLGMVHAAKKLRQLLGAA